MASPTAAPGRVRPALYAIPAALWLAASALAWAAGVRFRIVWPLLQLLDRGELLERPLTALALLHGQPPGLNAVLALVANAAAALGVAPEALAAPLFAGLGLASALMLFRLGRAAGGGIAAAAAVVALAVADPGFHVFSGVFFYPLPLYALLLASLVCAHRWLGGGGERWLLGLVLALGATVLTRSLYHPLWAAAALALVVGARARLSGRTALRPRRLAAAAALLTVLAAAWPLKNLALFGDAMTSSWIGFNLGRGTPVREPELGRFIDDGVVAPELAREWAARGYADWIAAAPAVTAIDKAAGGRNWNHYVFLLTHRELTRRALSWRAENPGAWAELTLAHYLMWTRPTYTDSYWGTPRGPEVALWRGWCRVHAAIGFLDLRPAVERLLPGLGVHRRTRVWGGEVPYTLFGLVLLPAVAAAAAWRWRRRRGARTAADWTVALAAFHLAWLLVVPCLTDGVEGNRIRFPASPALLLLAVYALRGPRREPAGRGAESGAAAGSGAGRAAPAAPRAGSPPGAAAATVRGPVLACCGGRRPVPRPLPL